MTSIPDYARYAFDAICCINTEEWLQADSDRFAQRWSGLDLATFAHVLQVGDGEDQVVAAFAVGHTHSQWGQTLLRPHLYSPHDELRWSAALSLGEMQDEHAQPMLIQMLQEYLPPPYSLPGELRPDWFDIEHLHIAQILGDWGDTSLIPTLRAMMLHVWEIERGAPAHLQGMGVSIWQDYQEELSYALGRLGDFPFLLQLKNIGAPDYRVRVWTINLALGYAHIKGGGMKRIDIVDGATRPESPYAHFGEILLQILQQHAGWDRQEALTALRQYGYDYFQRHETTTPSEQQKE